MLSPGVSRNLGPRSLRTENRELRLKSYNSAHVISTFSDAVALVVWVGGIIFFAFVVAPTVFSPGLLPTRHMAGSIVGRSLGMLHAMAIVSGFVFLIASMVYCRMTVGNAASPSPAALARRGDARRSR